jgi:uncharacterized membrane protein
MGVGAPYEIFMASFGHLDGAAQALAALERVERADLLDIENAAVVVKDAAGRVDFAESEDPTSRQGLGRGLLLGGLLGLLLPGRSAVREALSRGARSAVAARLHDTGFEDDDIRAMAETMAPGTSLLVAIVHYGRACEFVALLDEQGAETASAELSPQGEHLLTEAGRNMKKQHERQDLVPGLSYGSGW